MGDIEKSSDIDITSSSELTASLMEQLGKAFVELEAHKVVSTDEISWDNVEEHFHILESRLKKELEELEAKEKGFAERQSSNHMVLAEREAAVIAKEQDMLGKLQELKDAAVASIIEARANCENKVSSSTDDENPTLHCSLGKSSPRIVENEEGPAVEVNPCPDLTQFCEQMDSKGLRSCVAENLKNISDVCKEQISVVLGSASDPSRLVLDALDGIFPPKETTKEEGNGDSAALDERKSCLILMEALSAFLSKAGFAANDYLNPEAKQHALAIANEWRPELAEESFNTANMNSMEAEGFLRLLATFRIASEFDGDELCKFVLAVAHHRQATELCRSLELAQKIPGIVDTLIRRERQIDAVHFIHAFQLSFNYSTVPLLKAYLRELRRKCQGTGNAALQNDYNARELAAVRAVIECVENYKLEDAYPLDPLYRRVAQLDKFSRGGRKRITSDTTVKQPDQKRNQRPSGPQARGYGGGGRRVPPPFRERVPYGYYGQQDVRQPSNLYITSAAAPSYGAYTQSPHYPYI